MILKRLSSLIIINSLQIVYVMLMAQSPGGISGNLDLWLKADAGTSSTTDGSDILTWTDQSVNNLSGSSNFFSTKPIYTSSGINYNPAVSFDGTGAGFLFPDNTYPTGDENYSIYVILKSNLSPGIHTIINAGPWVMPSSHHIYLDSIGGLTDDSWGSGADNISAAGILNTDPALLGFYYSTDNNSKNTFINGLLKSSVNGVPNLSNTWMGHILGAGYSASYKNFFDGRICEVIAYNADLSNSDRKKVTSYLSIKYGITLGSTSDILDYQDSDGTTIWSGNTTYQNDIGGIGRDDASALNQKQSRSENNDAILSIGLGTIVSTNGNNPNSFSSDKTFLIWGNDNGSLTDVTSDLPSFLDSRFGREWKVQATESISYLEIHFDLTGLTYSGTTTEDFVLIIDRDGDGDFTSGVTKIDASGYTANVVSFESVTLNNGDVFTISTEYAPIVPGGISKPLQVWYKVDEGVTGSPVTDWKDQSTNNYDLDATAGPDLLENQVNFNPALSFDGSTQYLKADDGILRSGTFSDFTFFVVNQTDVVEQRVLFEQLFTDSRKINANIPWDNNLAYFNVGPNGSSGTLSVNWSSVNGEPAIWTHCSSSDTSTLTGSNKSSHVNGQEMGTTTKNSDITGGSSTFYLGTKNPTQKFYQGYLSEFIVFTGNVTATEFQKVNSYLALKYGITLSNNNDRDASLFESPNQDGNHEGDYLSSDGIAVWDASANQAFHNDIAGIGLDITAGLNQKQSFSSNGDIVAIGLREVANSNASNNNEFVSDESYLIWGNNNDGLTEISTELPSGIPHRLEREWMVQKTGSVADLAMKIYLSGVSVSGETASEFRLLVDTDSDGDFTTGTISQFDAVSCDNDTIGFENINFSTGDVFTLGIIPNEPPYITSTPPDSVEINDTYTYNISSTDPEGSSIGLSAQSIPAWLTLTDNGDGTGTLSGSPGCDNLGDTVIILNVSDGHIDSTQTFTLTVWGSDTEDPVVSGLQSVCTPVQENYSVTDPGDHTFLWTATNGSIVGSDNASTVAVEWTGTTQGSLEITITSGSGCINNASITVDKFSTPSVGDIDSSIMLTRR